jgi:hypothetical protein
MVTKFKLPEKKRDLVMVVLVICILLWRAYYTNTGGTPGFESDTGVLRLL